MLKDEGKIIRHTFSKNERLNSKKDIQELFENGSSFYLYPFKVIAISNPQPVDYHKVLFSVPRRKFKSAVVRNLIKRRLREAYRLNKQQLLTQNNEQNPLFIAYIYIGRDVYDFNFIESKLIETFARLKSTKR